MSTPVETTAPMEPPAEPDETHPAEPGTAGEPGGAAEPGAAGGAAEPGTAGEPGGAAEPGAAGAVGTEGEQPVAAAARGNGVGGMRPQRDRRDRSPALMAGLLTVIGGLLTASLMWQFNSLGNRIDNLSERIDQQGVSLRAEIDQQGVELRAEIAELRAEMRAGFRDVNETLLDHTDRLARLETAVGLERLDE